MVRKIVLVALVSLASALLTACGGGSPSPSSYPYVTAPSPGTTASPTITVQPVAATAYETQTVTFSVTASGSGTLSYQWRKNGVDIGGATSANYVTTVTLADNGSQFSVTISNGLGTVTSNAAVLTVQAANVKSLVISEVASCFDPATDCWLEVYNPTSTGIDLATYQLKTGSLDVSSQAIAVATTFTLPSFTVAPGAYVVISGNVKNLVQRSSQMLRLRQGAQVPYWTGNGFIELLSAGATVDFVRFGSSNQAPVTSGQWTGPSVTALPSSTGDHGKAIVRPGAISIDTHSASDWSSVNWATPAGRNDVPIGALDADGDGIPDSAEIAGGTFAGLDLYAMGARTGQKDLFVEVDAMNIAHPAASPQVESLQKVVDAFAVRGFSVHFDAGAVFSSTFSTTGFNLGQDKYLVQADTCVTLDQTTCTANSTSRRSIYDWKEDNMDLRRRPVFHYLLIGYTGGTELFGSAESPGNDSIITMVTYGWPANFQAPAQNMLVNFQAATIMHGLGHNLGLRHGGFEDTDGKPNYWSVMNATYAQNGLDASPGGATAYQRWRNVNGDRTPNFCSLPNSPCGLPAQFLIDYSDGSAAALDENFLLESSNIGRGSTAGAYADWNMDGSLTPSAQSLDLNKDGLKGLLRDYNDWANLVLPFNRSAPGSN